MTDNQRQKIIGYLSGLLQELKEQPHGVAADCISLILDAERLTDSRRYALLNFLGDEYTMMSDLIVKQVDLNKIMKQNGGFQESE